MEYLGIRSNRFPGFEFISIIGEDRSSSQWWNIVCPRIIVRSSSNPFSIRKPPIEIHPGRDTWYIWRRGEFRGVEAFEISKFEMSTQVFRDRWNVEASDIARNTHNPIRSIVESLVVEPNPAKSVISLSIGEIFFFCVRACVCKCVWEFYFIFLAHELKNRCKNTIVKVCTIRIFYNWNSVCRLKFLRKSNRFQWD